MNGKLFEATLLLVMLAATIPPSCVAQTPQKPTAASPSTAQTTGSGQIDSALSPQVRDSLKGAVRGRLTDRRLQLENLGTKAVQAVTVANFAGGIPNIDRLNALDPDPIQRREVEMALAAKIRALADVAPYTGLADVNTRIDEHASALVRGQLASAVGGQFQRALAATPEALDKVDLPDLGAIETLVVTVAQAKWDAVSGQTAKGATTFSRLSKERQTELKDKARLQVAKRADLLVGEARNRLEKLAKDPKHTWPVVSPDSRAARNRIIADAADKLLGAASIPSNAGTKDLVGHAKNLAGDWFDVRLAAEIRSDQLAKLDKLRAKYKQYLAAKAEDAKVEFPLPKIPKPAETLTEDDLKSDKKLKPFVDAFAQKVMAAEWDMKPEEAVTELQQGLASFLQPVVRERLTYYRNISIEIASLKERLGGEVPPIVPGPGLKPPPNASPPKFDGVDRTEEVVRDVLRRSVAAKEIADKVKEIQKDYHIAEYGLTANSLDRLKRQAKLPTDVAKNLQPLVGQVFKDQASYDAAVKKALAGLGADQVLFQVVQGGKLDPSAPTISSTSDSVNSSAVEYHRDRILQALGYKNPIANPQDPLFAQAKSEAEKAAKELVTQQKEILARLQKQAEEVARQLRAKSVPGVGPALSPFGSLRTADKRVFGTYTEQEEIAREIASEVLRNNPPEVRYDDNVVRAIRGLITEAAKPARNELEDLVRSVYWQPDNVRGKGPVRTDILEKKSQSERSDALKAAINQALQTRSVDIADKLEMESVRRLVDEHVEKLYEQIATIPSPSSLQELDTYLRLNIKLGEGNISSRDVLARKGAADAQKSALTAEIENRIRDYRPDLAPYLKNDEVKKAIKDRAAGLFATPENPVVKNQQPAGSNPSSASVVNPVPNSPPNSSTPPKPTQTPPPAKVSPAKEPPAELDLVVAVKADPNSQSLEVTISCSAIKFTATERISQTDDRTLDRGIETTKGTLREKSPDLILKAFAHTQGKEARFAVRMDLKGKRVPTSMPRDFAVMINDLFAEWKEKSPLIRPTLFGEYTTDQGTKGKLEDLIPAPSNPSSRSQKAP